MDYSMPGFPFLSISQTSLKLKSLELGCHLTISSPVNPFSSCLHSFPESVFSNESVPHFRQTDFWSFRFSISLFNEYSRLISFTFNWFDLLAVQGIPKVFSITHSSILLSGNCDPKSSQSLPLTLSYKPNVSTNLDSLSLKCVLCSQSHWKLWLCSSPYL